MTVKVKYKQERCKQCGLCVAKCPKKAISFSEDMNAAGYRPVTVDHEKCIGCGACYIMCPDMVYEILAEEDRR
jgi:2-oxoglutarate ferredoxin oxidoreductase subunit delta